MSGDPFEKPAWAPASMPESWTIDEYGKRVDESDEQRAKAARMRAALDRVVENEKRKGES